MVNDIAVENQLLTCNMFQVALGWEVGLKDVKRQYFTYGSYSLDNSASRC